MHYSLLEIAALIGAHHFGNANARISWLLTDSRSLAFPESTLFFALHSQRNDGHRYIAELYRRGVRSFVVGTVPDGYAERYPEASFLLVVSPIKALQRLAERHREAFSLPVVGVTGSNGKTIVKEWLYQLLAPSYNITRSPRSYNSQVGVPLSVCLLNEQSQLGIFEAGISRPDEMQALRNIIQPTVGVMTNIGAAHQENFATFEEKCLEKLSLFKDCDCIVYDADDPIISACVEMAGITATRLSWSVKNSNAPLYISSICKKDNKTQISYTYLGHTASFEIPFIDEASIQDALHCLAVCLYLHLTHEEICERMPRLEPVALRLEVRQGVRNCTIINDSYNSDITSLDIALDFMARRPNPSNRTRTLLLSDILQSGLDPQMLYRRVAEMVESRGVDHIIGVGTQICAARSAFRSPKTDFFPSTEALLQSGILDTLSETILLVKGARQFNFDHVAELLSLRVHETILEINLEAVTENLNYFRSFLASDTRMVCMIKASAYGTGAVEIAKTLQDRGVDYLAVAVADEGVELRKAGITSNILIMNPEMTSFDLLFQYNLEPEVYNFGLLDALRQAAKKKGITDFPIHIKLDTGMTRLGFDPETELERLAAYLKAQKALIPRSVFSHFVGSDSPDFDDFSTLQFERFDRGSRYLQSQFSHRILRHICNTAGIERFPERHLDMVRLGLGLYGIDPIDNRVLHNVATLKSTILQIHDVQPGTTVGYSRRGKIERPSRIAAVPIGYADGLNRHLGNGNAYCLVNGQRAPYTGNICMDVCMIDVTDIDCREGDTVEIFGDHLPVSTLSDILGTIPYEILTNISERVKRVYYQG